MRRLDTAARTKIVKCIVEGCSVRSTARLTGASKDAVLKLVADLGGACARFHDRAVRDIRAQRVQLDELWSFVGVKASTIKRRVDLQNRPEIGDAWVWVCIDADTKLVISWFVGKKDPESADWFMQDVASRITGRPQVSSDGFKPYFLAVPQAFRGEVDFGRIIKEYGTIRENGSIGASPVVCVGCRRDVVTGEPDEKDISTSFVERTNLTTRMHARRFGRSTNAHSKKWENHVCATNLLYCWFNWCRYHSTLRKSPAMAAGLTDRLWSIEDLVGLLDAEERAVIGTDENRRGPYRKAG